jgi:hypothetical protein
MYGLLDIIKHFEAAAGRTYHLASGDPILVSALATRDYPGFHVLRIIEPAEFCSTALDPAESWLYRSVTSHFGCYLRPDPHFPPPRAIQGSESVLGITTTASSGKIVSA